MPAAKRLKDADSGISERVSKTFKQQLAEPTLITQLASLKGLDSPERIFRFVTDAEITPTEPPLVYLRDCHVALTDLIITKLADKHVILAGGRGTGKSWLGTLIALKLALENKLVVYAHRGVRMLLIGPKLDASARRTLEAIAGPRGYDLASFEPGVLQFGTGDEDFFTSISKSRGVLVVHDIGDDINAHIIFDGDSKRLIVSSPNSVKLKPFGQSIVSGFVFVFMPPWSLEELKQARTKCYPDKPEDLVCERFERMGGTARYVLQADAGVSEERQDKQVANARIDVLRDIFTASSYSDIPASGIKDLTGRETNLGTDLLFKVVPTADYLGFRCEFASEHVTTLLAERFAFAEETQTIMKYDFLKNIPTMAAFRGSLVEYQAHKRLRSSPGARGELRALGDLRVLPWTAGQPVLTLKLPPLHENVFADLEELKAFPSTQYCRPRSKNFKSVDSFAVLPAKYFDAGYKEELALVGFQVTVSSTHKVIGSGLKRVADHVKALRPPVALRRKGAAARPPPRMPIFLVFIGDHNQLRNKQDVVSDGGAVMVQDIGVAKQFSLTLDSDFQALVQWSAAA